MYSFSSTPISSISAPDKFTFDGIRSTFSTTSFTIVFFVYASPKSNSYNVFSTLFLSTPNPLVVFPCGSMSIVSTFFSFSARHAERLIAVVDLPTPPFWFATAITLPKFHPPFGMSAIHLVCIAHRYYYSTFSFIVPQNVSRETLKFEKVFKNLLFIFDKMSEDVVLFQITYFYFTQWNKIWHVSTASSFGSSMR